MRARAIQGLLLSVVLSLVPTIAADDAAAPAWFLEHIQRMAAGSGRWIADNAAYQSDDEPFDAYGTEWKLGLGGKSLTGRLFGLQDGKEVATFWEFRSYWHPGEKKAYAVQYGLTGIVGIGPLEHVKGNRTRSDQTFFRPDGGSSRTGHDSWFDDDGRAHHTESFDIQEDGTWKKRRGYVWKLEG